MIKIWNWFKAIGSFVRKIKEKNTSTDLSNWTILSWSGMSAASEYSSVKRE
jgi:hypothetical protein